MSHINLAPYGVKVIIPSELMVIDYRELKAGNLAIVVSCPLGKFTAKFDSPERADEFVGLLTGHNMNFDWDAIKKESYPTEKQGGTDGKESK